MRDQKGRAKGEGVGEVKGTGAKGYYLRHKKDKKDWVTVSAQISDHTARAAGIPLQTFYTHASLFVDAQIAVQSYYGFDSMSFTNDVYNFEAEALGVKLVYSDDVMPALDNREPLIKDTADLKQLKTPDFLRAGRFPYQLEVFRQKKELGINQAAFCGPFSLAVALRSYPLLVRDFRKNPGFFKDLMQFIVDKVTMPYIETVHKHLGITAFRGADAWASFPILSPPMLEELVLPWNLEVTDKSLEMGLSSFVFSPGFYGENQPEHFDDAILRRCYDFSLASLKGTEPFLRIGRQPGHTLEPFLQYALDVKAQNPQKPVRVVVRVDSKVLRDGPAEKIIHYIKSMLDTFCPGFPVSVLLANVSTDTPPEHIHAAVQSTHYYGKLPYEFQDDGGAFQPKKREKYLDFLSKIESL